MTAELLHRIAELNAQVEYLQAELALKNEVLPDESLIPLMRKFELTKQQAKLLFKLSDGRPCDKYVLTEIISVKDVGPTLVGCVMVKLRKKIKPVEIKTRWGTGYQLEGESLDAIRGVLRAAA